MIGNEEPGEGGGEGPLVDGGQQEVAAVCALTQAPTGNFPSTPEF